MSVRHIPYRRCARPRCGLVYLAVSFIEARVRGYCCAACEKRHMVEAA